MGNKDEKLQNKKHRKIKIRLADPDIPNSYVCEIIDSSFENEEEPINDFLKSDKHLVQQKDDYSKPKNYFEILMSKECRKSVKINSAKENEEIPGRRLLEITEDEKTVKERKEKKERNKKILTQLMKSKSKTSKEERQDLSEDESLFEVQRKFKSSNTNAKVESEDCVDVIEEVKIENEELLSIFSPTKVNFSKNKTLSILNYFSPNSTKYHKAKFKRLEEFNNQNLKKICQAKNNLESKIKNSVELGKNENKIPLNSINKENVKLAPLFQKKEKKIIDPATQKARLEFLFKSSPTPAKKPEGFKNAENVINFPTVSHIQQRDDSAYWSVRKIALPVGGLSYLDEYIFSSDKRFHLNIGNSSVVKTEAVSDAVKFNKELLSKMKSKYLDLKLDLVIDGLKEKRDKFKSQALDIEKRKTLKFENFSNEESGLEVFNTLWSEKYKPKSSELLGNRNVATRLRKWLQAWKTFDEELKALFKSGKKLKNEKDSDEDDFLRSDDDDFGLKAPGNVCILSGPSGCGKTTLIFALAQELEFSVLELNASSRRTGKKVLSDLHEATQSHKVQRVSLLRNEAGDTGKKKNKIKKRKKSKKTEYPVKILEQANNCKISLILIEDADIVFEEHDEGFVTAIASLVQNSKRPLIFLTNESNCPHLDNFKTDHSLILEMQQPDFYKSCAVLDVVASLEGASLSKQLLESLLCQNKFDLRKSLSELQFWTRPGLNTFELVQPFDLGCLWWGLSRFMYKKDIKHSVKPLTRKRKRMSDFFDSSDEEVATKKFKSHSDRAENRFPQVSDEAVEPSHPEISCYSAVLDLMSTLDGFRLRGYHEPVPGFDYKPKDSLSLEENLEEVRWTERNLIESIAREATTLSTRIFARKCAEKEVEERKLSFLFPSWEEIRWRESQEKASEELSVLVPLFNGRDKRSLNLDYLPAIRNICRVERNRLMINPKRKNRFYHYLNNLGVELTDENVDVNCDLFDS